MKRLGEKKSFKCLLSWHEILQKDFFSNPITPFIIIINSSSCAFCVFAFEMKCLVIVIMILRKYIKKSSNDIYQKLSKNTNMFCSSIRTSHEIAHLVNLFVKSIVQFDESQMVWKGIKTWVIQFVSKKIGALNFWFKLGNFLTCAFLQPCRARIKFMSKNFH